MDFQLSLQSEVIGSTDLAEPIAITPDTSLEDVLQLMKAQRSGSVVVCQEGALLGIFTERDMLRLLADGGDLSVAVREVMSRDVATVPSSATVSEVIQSMSAGGYRRIPVLDEKGCPNGIADVRGIIHYLVQHFPEAIYNLPPNPNAKLANREGA